MQNTGGNLPEGYQVIRPEESQNITGRSYQELIESYAQWFISDNPDAHNSSNVVFLRGMDFNNPPEILGYRGQPAIFVGSRALTICSNQSLFLPIILTLVNEIDDHASTAEERSRVVWRDTLLGDNPPTADQILIDGEPLHIEGEQDLTKFFVLSRDFVLHVPDVPYGRSLKDYLDIPISGTEDRYAAIGAYCLLFKFNLNPQNPSHRVVFHARGVFGPAGQYFSSGVYSINVVPCPTQALDRNERSALIEVVKQRMHDALSRVESQPPDVYRSFTNDIHKLTK